MSGYVPAHLRRLVAECASGLCEYGLIHRDDTFFGCEIEHVISEKHGGQTVADNLAFACMTCNRSKGSDIASLSDRTGQLCPVQSAHRPLARPLRIRRRRDSPHRHRRSNG
jgi:5-methylcytosine-specific restriction endonuclease McrA